MSAGRLSRFSLTYNGPTGQPFVVALAESGAATGDDGGSRAPPARRAARRSRAQARSAARSFNAALPAEARDKIELRACAAQPGGGPRCTPTAKVAVATPAPVISAECVKAKRARSKLRSRVRKLARQRRSARRTSARRRYTRELRLANKRLKATRRAAARRCA